MNIKHHDIRVNIRLNVFKLQNKRRYIFKDTLSGFMDIL